MSRLIYVIHMSSIMVKADAQHQNSLSEFIETAMGPIDALLNKLTMADRQQVREEAEIATCEALNINRDAFDERFNDPDKNKSLITTLQAQTRLSVGAHLLVAEQKAKLDRRVEIYLQYPGKMAPLIYEPNRIDVRAALSEALYTLTVRYKIPEAELDGIKRSLLHGRVTSYLYVQQLDKKEFQPLDPLQNRLALPAPTPVDNRCGLG